MHCHLGDVSFQHDLSQVLDRALRQGVTTIISSATSLPEIENSLTISTRYPGFVFTSIGSDPAKLEEGWVEPILQLIRTSKPRIIGIGEVGLDHFWVKDHEKRDRQLQLFMQWIRLASELKLPLTVHSRSAGQEALEVISSSGFGEVLMHAYDGKVGHAMRAAEEGIFFSIPVSVVHSGQKQKLVRRLPIESLMLETDAPALAPVRGDRNEPANVVYSARKIAELKRMDVEAVTETTSKNAAKLFCLTNVAKKPE